MKCFGQYPPERFNAEILNRVKAGTAWVIRANEYHSLPKLYQQRYYPLFRRADTTYRMYPQYMKPRRDIDPNTQVVTLVPRKKVYLRKQVEKNPIVVTQKEILPINSQVSVPSTNLRSKGVSTIVRETKSTLRNYPTVTTKYSRY